MKTGEAMKPAGAGLRLIALGAAGSTLALVTLIAAAGEAKGTLTYQSKSGAMVVTVRHAYLIKGPEAVSGKTIRQIVLSVADVAAKLGACDSMMCADGRITEGVTVDLDSGSRLNYWFVTNDQREQYSGTADPASLKLTTDAPGRVAGKWDLDDHAAGGPLVHVEFDAALVKELEK
jgi:hypothetical protein